MSPPVLLDRLEEGNERLWSIAGYFTMSAPEQHITPFSGIMSQDNFLGGNVQGMLSDIIGQSSFKGTFRPDIELDFEKIYLHEREEDKIRYTFRKEGAIWIGQYVIDGRTPIQGEAKCVTFPLTKLGDSERTQALIKALSL